MTTQSRVETPVTEPVHFALSVVTNFEGDHWVAHSIETGTYTFGETEEEALSLNSYANELVVAELKTHGETPLREYFQSLAINYSIGEDRPLGQSERAPNLNAITCAA